MDLQKAKFREFFAIQKLKKDFLVRLEKTTEIQAAFQAFQLIT